MRPVLAPEPERAVEPAPPPSFSIVIAAYQAAGTIGVALASAFAQTLPAADVVVSDDGSTDDLAAAVAPYADGVTFLRQANAGEGAAKNAAVREARGEFAVFLDADDVFLPERLEAFAELAASRPDLDILTSDALLEVDGTVVRRCYDRGWSFEVDDQRGAILERNFIFGLAAVRRSPFLEIGGFDESLRYATDWDVWCRLILGGSRVGLVAEPLARYRLRSTSLSARRASLLRGRCAVLEKALARGDLSATERRRATRALAENQRAALLAEAHQALADGASHARPLAVQVATARSMPLRTRLKALAAAAAPRSASRKLVRERERGGVLGPADVRFPP
jgi:GT2 family glycosyltransferase